MQEALLYQSLDKQRVSCDICQWRCVIPPGARGRCGTRENIAGRLYSLIADQVSAACVDPIEKKPLYHFYPGSRVYSLGTVGCSFSCPGCQNWHISRHRPLTDDPSLKRLTPAEAVTNARGLGAAGLCWTYNDPAIWLEYTLAGARLANSHDLYTAYVTNGTATRAHLDAIGPYLDAYRVDIKAFSATSHKALTGFTRVEGIREGMQYAHDRWGMHIECVTNVTPTLNDSDEELRGIAHWIATALGVDTPWHVTRFHPYEGLAHLPATPLATLDRAYRIGKEEGLRYIYLGNVPDDPRQHTCCPACKAVIIQRAGFGVTANRLVDGKCPQCAAVISGRWA
ncbi:MAG TPA: AmmeMemoRadiSam system radical SAM enzyme [Armatimonadota bacterium]|jgi:pyruvate formate lyase activating enzyme